MLAAESEKLKAQISAPYSAYRTYTLMGKTEALSDLLLSLDLSSVATPSTGATAAVQPEVPKENIELLSKIQGATTTLKRSVYDVDDAVPATTVSATSVLCRAGAGNRPYAPK